MLKVSDKFTGLMFSEEGISTMADAALYLKEFMNDDDRIVVKEIRPEHFLLFIEDSVGETIDIYGFLHP